MSMHMRHFIDGCDVEPAAGGQLSLVSPVTEQEIATAAAGTAVDVDLAVRAARHQMDHGQWSRVDCAGRAALLLRLADLVERDRDQLADMDARCTGRSPMEPRMVDVPNAIGTLRAAAGWANMIQGRTIPTAGYMGINTFSYTRLEPIGVVGAIVPWNAPLMILTWKLGALLAAGCTAVIKPAEETPMSALHVAKLCQEAGFPDGVVNVVTGTGELVGRALCEHAEVDKITFTGSPEAGYAVQMAAAPTFKRVTLELGGKSPQIVFADADFDAAVRGCATGLFINQGQVCAAGSRILVHESLADRFSQALAQVANEVVVGNPKMDVVPIDAGNYAGLAVEIGRNRGFMRKDCSMLAAHLFLTDHKATTINTVIDSVKRFRADHAMDGVAIRLASGNAGVLAATNDEVEKSERPMLLYVYLTIVLLVLVVYRHFRAVIACCVPLTVGTYIGYWFMSELQIGLTVATLPVMVLAVGIGVDYAFYIYNRLQLHMSKGQPIVKALEHSILEVGMATIFTALTLAAGVATWSFSELKFQADMGKLLAFMFLVNLVMAMTALPALAVWLEYIFPRRGPVRAPGILDH